jgi:hypothetical protein
MKMVTPPGGRLAETGHARRLRLEWVTVVTNSVFIYA